MPGSFHHHVDTTSCCHIDYATMLIDIAADDADAADASHAAARCQLRRLLMMFHALLRQPLSSCRCRALPMLIRRR